eukprot:m51a1_g3528 hypothetical protein (265) ;mRNA; r:936255-937132
MLCAVCGIAATSRCSRCHSVAYCCAAHQRQHWKEHKPSCRAPSADPSLTALCARVLSAYERTHQALDGTRLATCSFAPSGSWAVSSRPLAAAARDGRDRVASAAQWADGRPDHLSVRAYWAARLHRSATVVSIALLEAIQTAGKVLYEDETVEASAFSLVRLAVKPRTTGTLDETPYGTTELMHEWVAFRTKSGADMVIDPTLPQFGVWRSEWASAPAPVYVGKAEDHKALFESMRELNRAEIEASAATVNMVGPKVKQCLKLL